jgi:hypothetical protein
MNCTIHSGRQLIGKPTRYGTRWTCPVADCTVAKWGTSNASPADATTRKIRIEAHEVFDKLHQSGIFTRNEAYTVLAKYLKLPKKKTHIGLFNQEQCRKVIVFSNAHLKATGL